MLKIPIILGGVLLFSTFFTIAFAETQYLVVDAGDTDSLKFYLDDGDIFEYWISVDGGRNDDVIISVKNPYGGVITEGKIIESFNDSWEAEITGYFVFEFDNDISLISEKQIEFNYNIIKKPIIEKTFEQTSSDISSSGIPFGFIIFAIVIIVAIIVGVKIIMKSKKVHDEGRKEVFRNIKEDKISTADTKNLEILKERLAKGEITKDEYDKLKKEFT